MMGVYDRIAKVVLGMQSKTGHFIVVKNANSQLPLLGRDWLCKLRLDWPKMMSSLVEGDPRVHTIQVASWINQFPDVLEKSLGCLRGIKASTELKDGARPRFCKYRPIPFALRAQVEEAIRQQVEDIRQQVEDGELKPVEQSDWAAPIVVVAKKDGGIRICAGHDKSSIMHKDNSATNSR